MSYAGNPSLGYTYLKVFEDSQDMIQPSLEARYNPAPGLDTLRLCEVKLHCGWYSLRINCKVAPGQASCWLVFYGYGNSSVRQKKPKNENAEQATITMCSVAQDMHPW